MKKNSEPEGKSESKGDETVRTEGLMSSESIDLSYRHLSEPARKLFARMSFFPGGLSERVDLFELLGDGWKDTAEELTNYALAEYDSTIGRYTMLDPVRQYAEKKLDETEGDKFRRRAAEFWADFTRWNDLMIDIQSGTQGAVAEESNRQDEFVKQHKVNETLHSEGFAALQAEETNLVHAAEWALIAGEETGLGIASSIDDYLKIKARWDTKERLYQMALKLRQQLAEDSPEEYMPDVAMTFYNMGVLHHKMGYPDEALESFGEALEIYRKLSQADADAYSPNLAGTLYNIGALHHKMDHPDEALKHYEEALGIYREFYSRYPSAHARNFLIALRGALRVYEKMGMVEKAIACRQEIEEVTSDG